VLRGNSPAKIDDRGRLKIPNGFRTFIEDEHGRELFVTSLHGDSVRIYPMPVWAVIEQKLAQIPSTHPSRLKFLDRVNFFGQASEIDVQGRVVIPARLRETAMMVGEVDVFGRINYLEVWNHERFMAKLQREAFTDDDARALSDLGL
jgi:transcriptional regulator MraZ